MSKTVLRARTSRVPDGIEPQMKQWIIAQNSDNARDNQDLEDEFNKIGTVKRWTPILAFTTPGDLAVLYTTQLGSLIRTKDEILATFNIATSAFTFTTSSGSLNITGLAYTASTSAADSGLVWSGDLGVFQGITKAGYTQFTPTITAASNVISIVACGSAKTADNVQAADMPSGGSVILKGSIHFRIRS